MSAAPRAKGAGTMSRRAAVSHSYSTTALVDICTNVVSMTHVPQLVDVTLLGQAPELSAPRTVKITKAVAAKAVTAARVATSCCASSGACQCKAVARESPNRRERLASVAATAAVEVAGGGGGGGREVTGAAAERTAKASTKLKGEKRTKGKLNADLLAAPRDTSAPVASLATERAAGDTQVLSKASVTSIPLAQKAIVFSVSQFVTAGIGASVTMTKVGKTGDAAVITGKIANVGDGGSITIEFATPTGASKPTIISDLAIKESFTHGVTFAV